MYRNSKLFEAIEAIVKRNVILENHVVVVDPENDLREQKLAKEVLIQ